MVHLESTPWRRAGPLARYSVAIGAVLMVAGCKWFLATTGVAQAQFGLYSLAVLVGAAVGGVGPGLVATALATFAGWTVEASAGAWSLETADLQRAGVFLVQAVGIVGFVAFFQRMIERRQRDAQRMTLITDAVPALISYIDADFRYQLANREYFRWFNRDPASIRGRSVLDVLGEDAWDKVRAHMERALAGEIVSYETLLPYRNGGSRYVRVTYVPDRPHGGEVCGFAVLVSDVSAAKESERALNDQRALLAVSQTLAHVGSWVLELGGEGEIGAKPLRWSDETYRIFGYEPGSVEVTNDLFFSRVHPEDRGPIQRAVAESLRGGTPYQIEHRITRPDGELRWVHEWASIEVGPDGRPARMIGATQDITARKRTEETLRKTEALDRERAEELGAIMDGAPVSICVARDPLCREIVTNPAGARLLAVQPGVNVSQSAPDRVATFRMLDGAGAPVPPEQLPMQVAAATNAPVMGRELIVEYADGRPPVHVSVNAVPLRGPDGKCRGVIATLSDITPQKRAQEALRRSEERLRSVVENMPVMLDALDESGVFVAWNKECERVTGYAASEIVGNPRAFELLYPDAGERERLLAEWRERTHDYAGWEWTLTAKDGTARTVAWSSIAEHFPIPGWATWGVGVDVTERTRARAELARLLESERSARSEAERAARLKDEFLAVLGHELRTPLHAILGWTHLLRKAAGDAGQVARGVEVIERNARLQARLVSDLLDLSRIGSGKLRLEVERVDLARIAEAAVESLRPAAEAKGLRLQKQIDAGGLWVSGDPGRLNQIIWNLLINAVKFTERGGSIRVSLDAERDRARLTVTDTGQGIDPAFMPHIWDRFRQADASSARAHGGLGIGLAIVKQLVEMHAGSVRAESEGKGSGATFVVELPLRVPEAAEGMDDGAPRASGPVDLVGLRVLVVEDEPDAAEFIRRVLEEHRAKVETAGSAEDGLARLDMSGFDVILSDLGMPGTDGFEFISRVRSRGDRTAAAALTAFVRADDRARAIRSGFDAHVSKPVEPADLLATVRALARGRRAGAGRVEGGAR